MNNSTYLEYLKKEEKLSKESKDWLKSLTSLTFRSENQTNFLFFLCGYSKKKLIKLEIALKDNLYFSSPDDKEEVEKILKLKPKKHWFKTLDNLYGN